MNIIHHDIKAGNILLSEEGQVKLADFGVSQQFRSTDQVIAANYIGSPLYMSPEVLRKSVYNAKTDVWSLGITIIELAEGSPPNVGVTSFQKLLMLHERSPPKLRSGFGWSGVLNDFLAHCLVVDPAARSGPIELLAHPFLRERQTAAVIMPLVTQCIKMHDERQSAKPTRVEFIPSEVAEAIKEQASTASLPRGAHSHTQSQPDPVLRSPAVLRKRANSKESQKQISPLPVAIGNIKQDSIGPPPGSPPHTPSSSDLIAPGKQQDSIGPPPGTPPALTPIKKGSDSIGPPLTSPPPLTPNGSSPILVPSRTGGSSLLAQALTRDIKVPATSSGTPFEDPSTALMSTSSPSSSSSPALLSPDSGYDRKPSTQQPTIDDRSSSTASPLRFSSRAY